MIKRTAILILMLSILIVTPTSVQADTTTLYPNSDKSIGSWVDESDGTTDIYTSIDEGTVSPNDSDYISDDKNDDTYQCDITNCPSASEVTSVTFSLRARKDSSGGESRALEATIWINSIAVGTLNWSSAELDAGWSTKTTGAIESSWTQEQLNTAYIQVETTSAGGTPPHYVYVSASQVDIVYTPSEAGSRRVFIIS